MAITKIEAADGIMSKLVDLFFKGMDKLLDSAIEYQNDNGILRGSTVIPVKDSKDDDTEFIITLSPVEGNGSIREGTFLVNFKCEGVDDLKTEVDGVNYQDAAIVINKETQSKFEDIVTKILKANGLSKIQDKTEKVQDDKSHKEIRRIECKNKQEAKVTATVTIQQIEGRDRYYIEIEADHDVKKKFSPKMVNGADKLPTTILEWFQDNDLTDIDDSDEEWVYSLENWSTPEEVESSRKINMKLHKSITASETVVDLVKIYANYNISEAMENVDIVLDNDNFLDSLDEGDTLVEIIDNGEDLDVNKTDEEVDIVRSAQLLLNASLAFKIELLKLKSMLTGYEPQQLSYDAECNWDLDNIILQLSKFIAIQGAVPEFDITGVNHSFIGQLTYESPTIDKMKFLSAAISDYLDILKIYITNFSEQEIGCNAEGYIEMLRNTASRLHAAEFNGDYEAQPVKQGLVIQDPSMLL